jgi:hypothetical protein
VRTTLIDALCLQQRAAAGHRGCVEQAGGGGAGPVQDDAIGHATGTAAAEGIVTMWGKCGDMCANLGFSVCAPGSARPARPAGLEPPTYCLEAIQDRAL